MAEAAYAFLYETDWLRAYLARYKGTVYFTSVAIHQMSRLGVGASSLLYVMRNKPVVQSEPDPCGAQWIVEGEDEHGRLLVVTLSVHAAEMRVEVVAVETT